MIQIIKAADRYHLESDWLSAYWLFSFDRYYDPQNVSFGPLRVFNDDTVQPGGGFPTHPHREMEIVTYVIEGELEHKDSTGGQGRIGAGEVQRMTAGSGVAHSEFNPSSERPVHLLQIWVQPEREGLKPSYEQRRFTKEQRAGVLQPIASGQGLSEAVKVHQEVTFYVSSLQPGQELSHPLGAGRRAFLYVMDGELSVNGERLNRHDQARITDASPLRLVAAQPSEIILIDLP